MREICDPTVADLASNHRANLTGAAPGPPASRGAAARSRPNRGRLRLQDQCQGFPQTGLDAIVCALIDASAATEHAVLAWHPLIGFPTVHGGFTVNWPCMVGNASYLAFVPGFGPSLHIR
ncbi:hypothetical protein [Nocardia bovistercoris]|uniref:Uncharacterized protein n=1 Tax=Nocardia bovistercoris TaxID=2785916 RepID=A0A931IDD5_9NOCA|nr:hypothetical protein [Nocardia bovistercoris]MBH0779379.1 hypothetical protein [Nocardia bovistercoris]